jgi:hypothetical protein
MKSRVPHPVRNTDTLQNKKATASSFCLVVGLKPPHPHKEKKNFSAQFYKKIGI